MTRFEGHTKGPWHMCGCGKCTLVWQHELDVPVARGTDQDDGFGQLADGRLIAAAPDLLEKGEKLAAALAYREDRAHPPGAITCVFCDALAEWRKVTK